MAEEGEKKGGIPEKWSKIIRNFILSNLKRAGLGEWHDVDVEASPPIEKKLKNEGLIEEFVGKIKLLINVEKRWQAVIDKRKELMELYPIVGFIRHHETAISEREDASAGTRIRFKDGEVDMRIKFEKEFQKIKERNAIIKKRNTILGGHKEPLLCGGGEGDGTGEGEIKELHEKNVYRSEWVRFHAEVNKKGIEDYYPVPIAVPYKFWSSLIGDKDFLATDYLQGYFGYNKVESWKRVYVKIIERLIQEAGDTIECDNDEEKKIVQGRISQLKNTYTQVVSRLFSDHIKERENARVDHAKAIEAASQAIENFRQIFFENSALNEPQVTIHFRHTYIIVDPSRIEWPIPNLEPQPTTREERLKAKYGEYADQIIRIQEYKKEKETFSEYITRSNYKFTLKGGEVAAGLDENGWPLEVANEGYRFDGKSYQKGTVLKDIFNYDTSPRVVPEEFIVDMDVLLMANCIHNEWDAIRDDLRDGRYHPKSLTVIDYLLSQTKSEFADLDEKPEWETMSEKKMEGDGEKRFRTYTMYYLDDDFKKQVAVKEGYRRPTNVVPAFDKRAIGLPFVHLGRKYYYQTTRSILQLEKEEIEKSQNAKLAIGPFISTRGISQYIITEILSGMKYFEDAKKRLDVIAKGKGIWYDYGPRDMNKPGLPPLGPWG